MSGRPAVLLGAHVSIAGGHERAIERGNAIGCTALQVFTKNQVRWVSKPLLISDIERYRQTLRAHVAVKIVLAHGSYLYNFASPSRELRVRSRQGLLEELGRCELLGLPFIVVHPGAHLGGGERRGIESIVESLSFVLERHGGSTVICLETTAGQGSGIGYKFGHIGTIIRSLRDSRVGVCIDTCHIFAAGYDIRTRERYRSTLMEFQELVGLEQLKVIHLNDSKGALGSRVDRHMHIGRGAIGKAAFQFLMRDRRFRKIPKIIETPKKLRNRDMDRVNLRMLRSLAGKR